MKPTQKTVTEPARETPITGEADVIVCGGGPAGVGAALAAARAGARTVLIESEICLGGTATSGMINRLGPYHDQEKIILGGIPWEILRKLIDRGWAQVPEICSPDDWKPYWLVFDPEGMKRVLDELMAEAGVGVILDTQVAEPIVRDGAVEGVITQSKSGRQAILGQRVIDATGDGDVAARAGVPFSKGRPPDGRMQPVTLMSKFLNEDWPTAFRYVRENHEKLLELASQEVDNDFVWAGTDNTLHPEETYYNCVHVYDVDATNATDRTRAVMDMRRKLWTNMEVLRRHVPGCEDISLITTAAALGVRESRRIHGEYVLDIEDVLGGRQFADQVCRYACFVDIHEPEPGEESEHADRQLEPGESYGIPYRSLVPKGIENLLVAGRCFSATHEALASARMIPACIAMGQAAGLAAALSIESEKVPRNLDVTRLRKSLMDAEVTL